MSPHVDPITIYALHSFGIMVVISHARLHVTTVFLSTDTCSAKLESYPDNSGPSYGSAPSSQNPVFLPCYQSHIWLCIVLYPQLLKYRRRWVIFIVLWHFAKLVSMWIHSLPECGTPVLPGILEVSMSEGASRADRGETVMMGTGSWESGTSLGSTFIWKLRVLPFGQGHDVEKSRVLQNYYFGGNNDTWHPTPVLLPGKSHGQRSLVGCSPWGR